MQVQDVIFNTKTNKVEKILEPYDTTTLRQNDQSTRWLSLDPLASKYPSLSPYNFVNNNPIIYVDPDGREYGLFIDHRDKTITVIVNFYTANFYNRRTGKSSDYTFKMAQTAATFYNNNICSTYNVIDNNNELISYTVNFHLNVIQQNALYEITATNDPIGNSFAVHDQLNLNNTQPQNVIENLAGGQIQGINNNMNNIELSTGRNPFRVAFNDGPDIESNYVMQNQDQSYIINALHEIGHSLISSNPIVAFFFHNQPNTFLSSQQNNPNNPVGLNIPNFFISQILGQAGLGTSPFQNVIRPRIQIQEINIENNKPDNFDNGTTTP